MQTVPIYRIFKGTKERYAVLEVRSSIPSKLWQDYVVLRIRNSEKKRATVILRLGSAEQLHRRLGALQAFINQLKKSKEVKVFEYARRINDNESKLEVVVRRNNGGPIVILTAWEKRGGSETKLMISLSPDEAYALAAALRYAVDRVVEEMAKLMKAEEDKYFASRKQAGAAESAESAAGAGGEEESGEGEEEEEGGEEYSEEYVDYMGAYEY